MNPLSFRDGPDEITAGVVEPALVLVVAVGVILVGRYVWLAVTDPASAQCADPKPTLSQERIEATHRELDVVFTCEGVRLTKTDATTDELHPGRDILLVHGTWVYDSAHEGWNEIHPIKVCQLVGSATYLADDKVDWDSAIGDFMVASKRWRLDLSTPGVRAYHKDSGAPTPQDWRDWVRAWCDSMKSASSDLTVDHQSRPENTWHTHPVIDGCEPAPEPDPNPIH